MLTAALNRTMNPSRLWTMARALAALLLLVGCNTSKPPAPAEAGPKTFATPDDAGAALVAATKAGDRTALLAIFGSGAQDLIFSGDATQDKQTTENFTAAYQAMNRWRKQTDGSEVLIVGIDNHPFPIPLTKTSAGQWSFDTAAGKAEIRARRVGDLAEGLRSKNSPCHGPEDPGAGPSHAFEKTAAVNTVFVVIMFDDV